MNKLLIFYLTSNDRPFVFDKFIFELNKSKYKNNFKLLIVNSSNDHIFYQNCLNNTSINHEIVTVSCPQSNYLPKVRFAIQYAKNNDYEYILKYDSDVLMPTYTFDYVLEKTTELKNVNNLTIGPLMTTGIPTVELFINDFLNQIDSKQIRDEFKKCVFNVQPGIMDYQPLNKYSIGTEEWNYENYYNGLNSYMDSFQDFGNGRTINGYSKFYRGIHPIRHGFGNDLLNNMILKQKEKFFSEKKCYLMEDNLCKQLVAMCFVITTDNYDKIINRENLLIDGCDEIPINRYGWMNNAKHLIVRNGFAIHITYNWRWFLNEIDGGSNIEKPKLSLLEYEKNFIKQLYDENTN